MKARSNEQGRERLIFALDVGDDRREALEWVARMKDHVGLFKVGKEAFTRFGPVVVEDIISRGGRVFLDLKFHDIPNTVGRAVEAAMKMPLAMLNVHALGGAAMMREAAAAARRLAEREGTPAPALLAVTILTSLNDDDVKGLGFRAATNTLVRRLALMARESGLAGVVASARDAAAVRELCGDDFLIVTPGIRFDDERRSDDQKRTLTPREAVAAGTDYIVVGRPLRNAPDPESSARRLARDIEEGLALRKA